MDCGITGGSGRRTRLTSSMINQRTVSLRSGGSLTLTLSEFNLFEMDQCDREFLASLVDLIAKYQAEQKELF